MKGLVIKNTGSWYVVKSADGEMIDCKVKGNFRLKGLRTTNPVAVGDNVEIQTNIDGTAFITNIEPRKHYIIRRASNLSKESHIIASNLDQAFLVISIKSPATSTIFVDRFLATAEAYDVPVIIVVNKIDILDEEEMEYAEAFKYLYETIGYKVILMSAIEEDAGISGVGKSTIINKLLPGINLKVGEISETHHTGMHTTTFSEMFELPQGGYIIDTPGVKGFGTIDFDASQVAHYFPEIFKKSEKCKYYNCTHTHEPECAVRAAVENSEISESRYASYLNILEDNSEGKYRKPY